LVIQLFIHILYKICGWKPERPEENHPMKRHL